MKGEVDINAWYKFTDQDGKEHVLKGSNSIIQESFTRGLPICVNDKGEYYIDPYVEQVGNGVVAHMPSWFKETPQYKTWTDTWAPTIKNTEINSYTVSLMNDVLKRLSNEAAPGNTSSNVQKAESNSAGNNANRSTNTTQPSNNSWHLSEEANHNMLLLNTIALVASIIIAIVFANSIKEKIRQREKFSGAAWGLLNGVVGLGLIWTVIAHSSINKEIAQIRDKRYAAYAKNQMKSFIEVYGICICLWIVAAVVWLIFMLKNSVIS